MPLIVDPQPTKQHVEYTPEYHDADCDCSQCQQEDRLGYDADFQNPNQFCIHGTFIGSFWGPDYMCGPCEMGQTILVRGTRFSERAEMKGSIYRDRKDTGRSHAVRAFVERTRTSWGGMFGVNLVGPGLERDERGRLQVVMTAILFPDNGGKPHDLRVILSAYSAEWWVSGEDLAEMEDERREAA